MNITPQLLAKIKQYAGGNKSLLAEFFTRLKRTNPRELDSLIHKYHDEVFSEINCLDCANCCKTISPRLYEPDIERMAAFLKIKVPAFKNLYVETDDDGDYVFCNTPCPFLTDENYCKIYSHRPKACREYPHTNRKRMYQILNITAKNVSVCPAVFYIVEKLKSNS